MEKNLTIIVIIWMKAQKNTDMIPKNSWATAWI
jgi:hypothetical protein